MQTSEYFDHLEGYRFPLVKSTQDFQDSIAVVSAEALYLDMLANNIFGDGGIFELDNVNLALFGCGLFNSHKVLISTKTTNTDPLDLLVLVIWR